MKKWVVRQSINHPIRTVIISLLITILFASGIRFLVIDDDFLNMLPKDMPSRVIWRDIEEEFGTTDFIYVAFGKKGESVFNSKTLAIVKQLTDSLETFEEIDEVISLASYQKIESDDDGFMVVSDMIEYENLTEKQVKEIKEYLNKHEKIKSRVISKNGEYLNIVIRPITDFRGDVFAENVISTADGMLKDYEIHYGGISYITGIIPSVIQDDVKILIFAAIFIMIFFLFLNFRNIYSVLIILATIILSMFAMLGFLGFAYKITGSEKFLFTMVNTSMPIILLTIANSDSVHILTLFFRNIRKMKDKKLAIKDSISSLFKPIFITSFTTALAFITLITAPIQPMIGFGLAVGFGVMWAFVLSSTLIPSLIILKNWKVNSKKFQRKSFLEDFIGRFGEVVFTHPKKTFLISVTLVLIATIGIFLIQIETNAIKFFPPDHDIRKNSAFLDKEMSGSMNITMKVKGDLLEPEVLKEIEELQIFLDEDENILLTISIVDVVKQMHQAIMNDDPKYKTIPDTKGKVANLFTMYSMSGDPDELASLVDYDYTSGLIVGQLQNLNTDDIVFLQNKISKYMQENITTDLEIETTGMFVFLSQFIHLLLRSSLVSIFVSIILIGLTSWIFFKNFRWGLLAVIPLSGAVIINFGLMGLLGVTLNHVIGLLTALIIGVGVDFAIHYIASYKKHALIHSDQEEISRKTFEEVGYPIALDVVSNLGFGAMLFSVLVPLQSMGYLAILSMLSTSIGTLTLLAPLMLFFKKKLIKITIDEKEKKITTENTEKHRIENII
ncbi:MAG: MMPL family transporter [Candidatus Marinimicrobia bacterium]|nr:MMPL family transporter [Candidatus Neomarinimicrobiota bacterium]